MTPLSSQRIAARIDNQDSIVSVWRIWMNEIYLLSSLKSLSMCVCMNADLLLIASHHTMAHRAWEFQTRQVGIKRLMVEGSAARNEKDN